VVLGVVALIGAVVMTGSAADARSKIGSVGNSDAPSVRATEDFLFRLQDMDAQLVNALLVNGDTQVHVPRSTSEKLYDEDRVAADGDLENATTALAGDPKALDQLHTVIDVFGQYQAQAARVLAEDERDGGTVAGQTQATVLTDYLATYDILFVGKGDGGLMQAATDLEGASADAIGRSASTVENSLTAVSAGFLGFGVVLLAGLVLLQLFLFKRFHRVLNPALAAATVVTLVFMIGGAVAANSSSTDFHTAKTDAFDSVIALSQAKATSSGMNADESRWLLAHGYAQSERFVESFRAGEQAIADQPGGSTTFDGYVNVMKQIVDTPLNADNLSDTSVTNLSKKSSFGAEFQNITFPTEGGKALAAFNAYVAYIEDDARLRAMPLSTPEQVKAAIDFDTNNDTPGTSDQTFNTYSAALDSVIGVNESHFESSMPASRDVIGTWTWLPYVLALLIIGLTVLGLRPRLNEYR